MADRKNKRPVAPPRRNLRFQTIENLYDDFREEIRQRQTTRATQRNPATAVRPPPLPPLRLTPQAPATTNPLAVLCKTTRKQSHSLPSRKPQPPVFSNGPLARPKASHQSYVRDPTLQPTVHTSGDHPHRNPGQAQVSSEWLNLFVA